MQHIFSTRVIFDHEWHLQFHVLVVRNKWSINAKWYIKGAGRQCADHIGVETRETRITRFFFQRVVTVAEPQNGVVALVVRFFFFF